jgi:hypothetical protein
MSLTWVAIGVVSAVVMGRRGSARFSWLVLGVVLGPLVIPLALPRPARPDPFPPGVSGPGMGPSTS